jgi:hypothetical protein
VPNLIRHTLLFCRKSVNYVSLRHFYTRICYKYFSSFSLKYVFCWSTLLWVSDWHHLVEVRTKHRTLAIINPSSLRLEDTFTVIPLIWESYDPIWRSVSLYLTFHLLISLVLRRNEETDILLLFRSIFLYDSSSLLRRVSYRKSMMLGFRKGKKCTS